MSKISRDGFEQIQVIKNALDSMYDKLSAANVYSKDTSKKVRDIEKQYVPTNIFESVKGEFEAISGIVELSRTWEEVK